MRLSRPCYDKSHRCPGWAGGGWRGAKIDHCQNGSIRTRVPEPGHPGQFKYPGTASWHFGHCNKCDTVTWPFALRWLDPRYWRWGLRVEWDRASFRVEYLWRMKIKPLLSGR